MSDLDRALFEIRSIRQHLAAATDFRGFGPLTLGSTAAMALLAGCAQAHWITEPAAHPAEYVALWLTTGVVSATMIVSQMLSRVNRLHAGMANEMVRIAVTQFLPAGVCGLVLPFVLLHVAPGSAWLLPGMWQIIFSLGVFASCRGLPRMMLFAGGWFLLTGFACVALGDSRALTPTAMAGAFGIGMALVAAIHSLSAKKGFPDEDQEF